MIYTLTLNPALDSTIFVKRLSTDERISVIRELRCPGGKGIDVSRVIKRLGGESIAIAFMGGFIGKEMEGRLLLEGITGRYLWISEQTRTNVVIHSIEDEKEIILNFPGPKISPIELSDLFHLCKSLHPKPTYAVISGSLPEGLSPTIYESLILLFESLGAHVILDTYGEAMQKGLLATPFMIKPNLKEFQDIVGAKTESIDEISHAAKPLLKNVSIIAISMGKSGILGIARDDIAYHAIPPSVKAKGTVGAGDSAVAAMVLALQDNLPYEEVFRRGAAAGTASTLSEGTANLDVEIFREILSKTEVKKYY